MYTLKIHIWHYKTALTNLEFFMHGLIMTKYLYEVLILGLQEVIPYQAKHCKGTETSTVILLLEEIIFMSDYIYYHPGY